MKMKEAERKLSKELAAEIEEMGRCLKMQKKIQKRPHVKICSVFSR